LKPSLKSKWLKFLWLNDQKVLAAFILFNLILSAILGFYTPRLIADFYQQFELHFYDSALSLVFLLGLEYFNRAFFQLATHKYIQLLLQEVRSTSYSNWLTAPLGKGKNKKDYPMGEVLARLMNDPEAVKEIVSSGSFGLFIEIIFIFSCLVSFLKLNSATGFSLFVAEVVICLLLIKGSSVMAKIFTDVRRLTGQLSRIVTDLSKGFSELYFNPHKKYASRRGEKIFEEFLDQQLKANIWDAGYYSAAESLYPILIVLVILMIPVAQIAEVAILAALIDLIQRSITPIKDVAAKISVIQRARSGIERLQDFNESFETDVAMTSFDHDTKIQHLNFQLKHFSYEGGFTLKTMSFELECGETIGILGESGCGKSTLLKLLSGQYMSFDGEVTLDERSLNLKLDSDLKELAQRVSLVSQDSHIFTDTLYFNITLGYEKDFQAFWQRALDFIPYLKTWGFSPSDKMTQLQLSMGQKQLLSGLRAMYLKKPIILMDEISSGLDSELELALRDLLRFFQSSCMTIIVTHRLETILHSTKLLLLEKGELVVQGSHRDLIHHEKYQKFLEHLS